MEAKLIDNIFTKAINQFEKLHTTMYVVIDSM